MLPLVVHQKYTGGEELGCSRWSFTRIYWGGGARVLPLVVHQNTGGEELPELS